MILKALYDLAQREELIPDPDFEIKPVSWVIRVGDNGLFLGIEKTVNNTPKSIPKRLTSRSGKHPPSEFFADNPLYALGKSIPSDKHKISVCKKRLRMFASKIILCGYKTKDAGAVSAGRFLRNINRGSIKLDIPPEMKMKGNDLIVFSYQMDESFVHERPDVVKYWREVNRNSHSPQGDFVCLITGEFCTPANKHKKLKNVPQKKISDIALAPCNQAAFESYGWKKAANAVIGEKSSDFAMTALNRLLHPNPPDPKDPNQTLSKQNVHLSSDTVVCYWTRNKSALSDSFGLAIEVDEEKIDAKPAQIAEMYKSIWKGIPYKLDKPDEFYSLVLSGGQGRATVRDWIESNTQHVMDSLAQYFADLKIERCCPASKNGKHPESFSLPLLLESLADPKDRRKEGIPSAIGAQFYRASINKKLMFPQPAFSRAILRYRAELGKERDEKKGWFVKNWNDARAAIIKAYLNRKVRKEFKKEEVSEKMNPTCTDKGYLLGQLMSVLEKLQTEALGNVKASIVDRYFSGASASPKSVFGSLLRNARHHARKAKDESKNKGQIFNLERLIDQICSQFDVSLKKTEDPKVVYENGFPAYLSQEQQGMFVLGYHQMRKWLWMKREERDIWNDEHSDASRAYLWKKKENDLENSTERKGENQ
ncbi:MAG: type I-C CRISPR-associated protein Cas8c/Csd1 [Desulfobacteraceae bacterium]|nr:type I-C CRISPR-associated protein Cas8c/Csd1 [Desulfobacteraceae bacterium]MBC2757960.1 type I-C CRISPR-associated protein Cas8c/Csd1 [Desulfobacteraceae bacterium]